MLFNEKQGECMGGSSDLRLPSPENKEIRILLLASIVDFMEDYVMLNLKHESVKLKFIQTLIDSVLLLW